MNKFILAVAGAVLIGALPAAGQQGGGGYRGPSILSMPGARGSLAQQADRRMRLRLYGQGGASYGHGLNGPATDTAGRFNIDQGAGFYGGGGAYVRKPGRSSEASFGYDANYTYYSRAASYSGLSQTLNANYAAQVSSRWEMRMGAMGRQQTTALGITSSGVAQDSFVELPNPSLEFFDTTSILLGVQAGASYRASARMRYTFTGGGFVFHRKNRSLISSQSGIARGEVSYSLSRKQQVGAMYEYTKIVHSRSLGTSDVHTAFGTWGREIGRQWFVDLRLGMFRIESQRLQRIQVDPLVRALTGIVSAAEIFHGINRGLAAEININGRFRNSSTSFGYRRGVTPGTSLMLTARQDAAYASYSFLNTSRVNVGLSGNYTKMSAILPGPGSFTRTESFGATLGGTYRMNTWLHFVSSLAVQRYDLSSQRSITRDRLLFRAGFAVSPGELPLALF